MLNERFATAVGPDHIDICYERLGDRSHPTVLLLTGAGAQLVNWPDGFVDALVARGLQVVRFDGRDSGRSTHLTGAPPVNFPAVLAGDFSSAPYTLNEMAADAAGLLDALGLPAAHFVGASMGGAISQIVAFEHPERVRSLTTMMSSTGAPDVGQVHPATMRSVFSGPRATTRQEYVDQRVRAFGIIAGTFPADPAEVAAIAGLAWDRDRDEGAMARQAAAQVASDDRTARLREVAAPTLVIHGLADTVCDPSGGRATAAAIPGAELLLIEGMGHALPRPVWDRLADAIAANVRRGEARSARPA